MNDIESHISCREICYRLHTTLIIRNYRGLASQNEIEWIGRGVLVTLITNDEADDGSERQT